MKILAISSSPSRKRNSDTMLDHFILGMKTIPNIQIEKIYLEDIKINTYKFENSEGPEEDEKDFKELTEKISKDINGLIIATPTYNYSIPSHLKNFVDRIKFIALDFTKRNRSNEPIGKLGHLKMYFLVSGGTPNWKKNILFFLFPTFYLKFIFSYYKAKTIGTFYSGDINTFKNEKILKKCFKKGIKYAKKLTKNKK